jgi:hypothetical protein
LLLPADARSEVLPCNLDGLPQCSSGQPPTLFLAHINAILVLFSLKL